MFPVHQATVESHGIAYGSEASKVLTNGAFKLTEWKHEFEIILEKNESYWDSDSVNLTKITGVVGASNETAVDMMLAGELDYVVLSNYDMAETLVQSGFTDETYTAGYQFVHMNCTGLTEESGRFMSNTNFRLALNYVVNREAIVKSVLKGATPAFRISSPNDMGVSDTMHNEYPYTAWSTAGDIEKAQQHLALALEELNATVKDVPALSMLCYESQGSMTILQAVQDMVLSALGIECVIDPQPIQQMLEKATSSQWDFWYGGTPAATMDWLSDLSGRFDETNPSALQGYYHEGYSQLRKTARTALDMKVRKDNLFELEKILGEDPGSILLAWTQNHVLHKDNLTGVLLSTYDDLTYADLAQ